MNDTAKSMTVAQLIAELSKLPGDATVTLGLCDAEANLAGGFFGDIEELYFDDDNVQLTWWDDTLGGK